MAFLQKWEKVLVGMGVVALLALTWVYSYKLGYISASSIAEEVKIEGPKGGQTGPRRILVHVAGEVRKAGVYELKEGTRVADAIKVAGGPTEKSDINAINLAKFLEDGEKVYIPAKETSSEKTPSGEARPGVGKPIKINVNRASVSEIESLPGIGSTKAQAIVEYRDQHGPFRRPEDLLSVEGIGEKTLERIKPHLEF